MALIIGQHRWRLHKGIIAWNSRNFTRINIYGSLAASNIAFIITEYVPDSGSIDACFGFAVISHWLIMATFGWLFVEYYRIFRITKDVFSAVHEVRHIPSLNSSYRQRWLKTICVWCKFLKIIALLYYLRYYLRTNQSFRNF